MTGHNRIPTKSSRFDFIEMSDEQFARMVAGWIPCAVVGCVSFALLLVLS